MKIQADKQAEYENYKAINCDPYGKATVDYSERWANLMEQRMGDSPPQTLEQCACETSTEANIDGITGFMYGCAVSGLAKFWIHGESLRQWHNLKFQIGTEGEKANNDGEVLNPALLSLKP